MNGYEVYVNELAKIATSYSELMLKRNSKGVTALQILINGSSRTHYECLQNSSRLMTRLGDKRMMLGTGTARNEQLHRELKSWGRNIIKAHFGRINTGLKTFVLAKLLTHSSAAYSPTLTQVSQSRLLSQIAGKIRKMSFFPPSNEPAAFDKSIFDHLDHPRVVQNDEVTRKRQRDLIKDREMWTKGKVVRRPIRSNNTNVFRRARTKTRMHSTK